MSATPGGRGVRRVPAVTRSSAAWSAAAAGRVARGRIAQPSGWWGMALFLCAEVTLFGTIIASYFYLDFDARRWPPPGVPMPEEVLPLIATGALVLMSLPLWQAARAARAGRPKAVLSLVSAALVIQLCYLALQILLFRHDLNDFKPQASAYGSIYFTLLAADHAHVLLGILLSLSVMAFIWLRGLTNYWLISVRALILYWHVVNAVTVAVTFTIISPKL